MRKISFSLLITIFSLNLFLVHVLAWEDGKERNVKWHYFFAEVQLYVKDSIEAVDQAGRLIEPYVRKFQQINSKIGFDKYDKINELSIETINEISFLQDKLNGLRPPEGFSFYHQQANQVFGELIYFVESSMKEKNLQEYAEGYLPLLIGMSEEIMKNYIKYDLPQEYINNQQHRIDELTLSLLKYKEFKRKITE